MELLVQNEFSIREEVGILPICARPSGVLQTEIEIVIKLSTRIDQANNIIIPMVNTIAIGKKTYSYKLLY